MVNLEHFVGNGKYEVLRPIGCGSSGCVYVVRDSESGLIVAIKLFYDVHLYSPAEQQRFLQEVNNLQRLNDCPLVLSILDYGIDGDIPYIVFPYVPDSLGNLMNSAGYLPVNSGLTFTTQLCYTLDYAHQCGIIHLNIKPENIRLDATGNPLLTDFTIPVVQEILLRRRVTPSLDTAAYMSPEYLWCWLHGVDPDKLWQTVGSGSDIYSVGCLLYRTLAGQVPFNAPTFDAMSRQHIDEWPDPPRERNSEIANYVEQAFFKAIEKYPQERFVHMLDLSEALQGSLLIHTYSHPSVLRALQKTQEQWIYEGMAHYEAGRYDEALFMYEHALLRAPSRAIVYSHKGTTLHALGRYQEAVAAYERASTLEPACALTYDNKGLVLFAMRQYKKALTAFERAIELDNDVADFHLHKSDVLRAMKVFWQARKAYKKAIYLRRREKSISRRRNRL